MTGNLIVCIIFIMIGSALALNGLYNFIKSLVKTGEEYRIIPGMILLVIGMAFIVPAIVHWNDDKEFKTIECSEYKIEKSVSYTSKGQTDTTYMIHYKKIQ